MLTPNVPADMRVECGFERERPCIHRKLPHRASQRLVPNNSRQNSTNTQIASQPQAPGLQSGTFLFPGIFWAALVAQTVKNLPAMWETRIQSLDQEDPLKKEMEPTPSILAWKIPWTEEPGGLQSMGLQRVGNKLLLRIISN